MKAEIVTIGTELLLGEIVNTNSAHLTRQLRDIGVNIYYLTTVGDNTERIADAVRTALARSDVVITTAAIPGKKAPVIITHDMVGRMKYGAIIVDMAAESGGNCELTQPGEHVIANDVNIHGPLNLPSRMPTHASELYAKNIYNFIGPWIKDGELAFDWSDEVVAGTLLCKDGVTVHPVVKQVFGEA